MKFLTSYYQIKSVNPWSHHMKYKLQAQLTFLVNNQSQPALKRQHLLINHSSNPHVVINQWVHIQYCLLYPPLLPQAVHTPSSWPLTATGVGASAEYQLLKSYLQEGSGESAIDTHMQGLRQFELELEHSLHSDISFDQHYQVITVAYLI